MGYPLATEFPRTRAPRQTPNPKTLDLVFAVEGHACAARARELETSASRRRERSGRGFHRRVVSAPAPHPTVVATMLPPRSFCQDLVRGKQRRAPRAREPRNFRGAERPSFQLSLKRGGSRRHMCPPVPDSREIHLPNVGGKGGRGEPPAQETRRGVR